jgi:hypothetical protein
MIAPLEMPVARILRWADWRLHTPSFERQ